MSVKATHITSLLPFTFECGQWALMEDTSKADWTVVENTCGVKTTFGSPYASSDLLITLDGIVKVTAPGLSLSTVGGVTTITLNIGAALSDLPEYANDEEAIADGLTVGEWYVFSDATDVGISGMAKMVR